ncbi:MAG: hypothetical protein D6679_06390 [Candidatus Hydrogenedentota bacterium]|nr:MAG: hypothetical protein D6679_06390 [Candidatus Hydrogenedentota bacterium]
MATLYQRRERLRRVISILLALGVFSALSASAAQNEDRAGANAGITLRFTPSTQAAALGDAFTAAADREVAALYYNPAGLGWSDVSSDESGSREIGLMYQNLVLDIGQGAIGYTSPLGKASGWGALVQYVDYGSTQRTIVSGTAGRNSGTFSGQDIALSLSYGAKLAETWGYGVTGKVFNTKIDNASATAFAFDAGLRWRSATGSLSLGLTARNVGTKLKFDQVEENLPTLFRLGAAWRPFSNSAGSRPLLITGDVEKIAREGWSAHVGAEYTLAEMLSLRVGYDGSVDIDNGLTAGAGFHMKNFSLDYAFVPFGDVGNTHRVGLRYRF